MDSLQSKVCIVTGASDGIGACVVALLRERGARLAVVARNEERLRAAVGPDDVAIAGDLTVEATRVLAVERTLERFGQIDVLVNNAGRGSYYPASEAPLDDARSLFELNFFAPLHLAQLATPHLMRTRGAIVHVNSIAGLIGLPWLPVYSASKFALAGLAAAQRIEMKKHGVNVMTVFPGYVDTAFQAHAAGQNPPAG
ncbi:MAG: SDR family NAD(P)-dependent oxidoreductase, partial [Acidobacteriota bacterium]|nr:SDR family NAD(P)-dependent oxidoreductase [Acidobacteriota bacterium]